ncbi:hypothetical protein D7B24_008004 [Verticillium nonalfalfae]|uniref:Mucin-7 n=1 Tax=Verticillium nonalfalfae TaxID=1051616 RepID=A0A3M9Y5R5_9PEZI|nr:uncharacterized protein D7B24_008004 [Verticillium nonalfalfae]RNJ55807.1 hypothetical protein D7B24_008004 [Verticillium nonalfalfae]
MSGVKNLRAMFEQKQDASPPERGLDRGRSPGDSSTRSETPPRPLSKVRTNFIAVQEKDGRIGLRRDPSDDGSTRSLSRRRLSVNTEEGSVSAFSERTMAFTEPIPESPRAPETTTSSHGANGTNGDSTGLLGAVTDRPSHNPDKHMDVETPTPKLLPADPTEKPPSNLSAISTDKATKATAATTKTGAKSPTRQLPSRLQTTKTTTKAPAKSPALPKTPTSLPRAAGATQVTKTTREPVKKPVEKGTTSKPATTTARTATRVGTSTSAAKKATPAPVSISSSGSTGFVKPKVKSPTRPVNLPSSLMAPTAASASHSKIARPTSRSSVSTTATSATTTTKTLRKQRSSINQSRPSLGPPPKKAQDHPVTKKEREVDEGFLARMMRPTQSSSSKLSDKAPITPPRKAAPKKDASSTKASTSTTASGRKKIGQPAFAATGSPGQKKIADTEQVALVETAEDAISVAAAAGVEEPAEASPARVEAEPAKELELEPTVVEEPELEEAAVEETAADVEADAKTDAAAEEAITESEPASASAETSPAEEDAAEVLPAVEDAPVEAVAVVEDEEEPKEPVILDTITPPPDLSTPEAKAIVEKDATEVADVEDVGKVLESLAITDATADSPAAKASETQAVDESIEVDEVDPVDLPAKEGVAQKPAAETAAN